MDNFCIKPGYNVRKQPAYFVDNISSEDIVWQPEVYAFAAYLARRLDCTHLIDVGCGQAGKLAALYPEFNIIGIDYSKNLAYCRSTYSFGQWLEHDIDANKSLPPIAKSISTSRKGKTPLLRMRAG